MFLLLAKTATAMFFPLLISFATSEILGWDHNLQPDALTQALWDSFKQRSVARILIALIAITGLVAIFKVSYQWIDHRLATPAAVQVPSEPAGPRSILCSMDTLSKQSFTGNIAGSDIVLRVDAVRPTEHGAEVTYTIVQGGDLRSDGRAFFDASTCTLNGIPALITGGRLTQVGDELTIVATEPRWQLKHFQTR